MSLEVYPNPHGGRKPSAEQVAAESFLAAVHPDGPGFFCIWSNVLAGTRFFACNSQGRAEAASYGLKHAEHGDIYVSMGRFAERPAQGRGKSGDVVELRVLWGEIDLAGPGHKLKAGEVLPDVRTAVHALTGLQQRPSLVVHSGGGLHLYWLLSAPLLTNTPATQEHAQQMLQGLREQIRRRLASAGESFKIDNVAELARVLRVPGTINHKIPGQHRPVQIAWPTDLTRLRRYDLSAFASEEGAASAPAEVTPDPRSEAAGRPSPEGPRRKGKRHPGPQAGTPDEPSSRKPQRRGGRPEGATGPGDSPIDKVLAGLSRSGRQVADRGEGQFTAQCPSHNDRHPSLSIKVLPDGKVLLHCFAGCTPEDVVAAIGLTMADLFPGEDGPRRPGKTRAKLEVASIPANPALEMLHKACRAAMTDSIRLALCRELGIEDLRYQYEIGWSGAECAWSFPMFNEQKGVIGIRYRSARDGRKSSAEGSRSGLFIPLWNAPLDCSCSVLICEGVSDVITASVLGFRAVGRPSANSGDDLVLTWCRYWKERDVAIMADNDAPGIAGAKELANKLLLVVPTVRVVVPPVGKDLRDWYRSGATRDEVKRHVEVTEPMKISIR